MSDVNSLYGVIGGLSGCVLVFLIVSVAAIVVCLLQHQKSEGINMEVFTCNEVLIGRWSDGNPR